MWDVLQINCMSSHFLNSPLHPGFTTFHVNISRSKVWLYIWMLWLAVTVRVISFGRVTVYTVYSFALFGCPDLIAHSGEKLFTTSSWRTLVFQLIYLKHFGSNFHFWSLNLIWVLKLKYLSWLRSGGNPQKLPGRKWKTYCAWNRQSDTNDNIQDWGFYDF